MPVSFFHLYFSLGGLLVFANDLQGSIQIDKTSGKVVNYEQFGGGIGALFTIVFFCVVLYVVFQKFLTKYGILPALIAYITIVASVKAALVYSIYFSGKVEAAILAAFPLNPAVFAPDMAVMILIAAIVGMAKLQN